MNSVAHRIGDITYIRYEDGHLNEFFVEHDPAGVWLNEEYGDSHLRLTPDQADAIADALKAHAAASREEATQ